MSILNKYSLSDFADWAEKQPKWKPYNGFNPYNCAVGQYLKSKGYSRVKLQHIARMPKDWTDVALGAPWFFGSAAKRARRIANERLQPTRGATPTWV